MTTLFDATLRVAGKLEEVLRGTATGGTTTTLVDNTLSAPADWYLGGTLWILSGTYANKYREVSAFAAGGTFTWITALAGAIVAGVKYAAAPKNIPLWALIQAINSAMNDAGGMGQTDDTLVSVASQEEYTLPAGVSNVAQLWLATSLAAPYIWTPHYHWRETPGGKIRFDPGFQPALAGYLIRLNWNGNPTPIALESDVLPAVLNYDRIVWQAAVNAITTSYIRELSDEKKPQKLINKAEENLRKTPRHMLAQWERTPHFAGY